MQFTLWMNGYKVQYGNMDFKVKTTSSYPLAFRLGFSSGHLKVGEKLKMMHTELGFFFLII